MISLHEPLLTGNEWKYVKNCLDQGWVSSVGKSIDIFEKKIAKYTGAQYAVACINGTSALQISLKLVGVKRGRGFGGGGETLSSGTSISANIQELCATSDP